MNKFEHSKIYTIRSHKTPLIYVGSTTEKYLSSRMAGHKSSFKRYKNGKTNYVTVFDILEVDNDAYIELYEHYPCNSDLELRRREGEVIRLLDCCNKQVAGRTKKEYNIQYLENNKEKRAAYGKQWRGNNREHLKEYEKRYYANNKEKINARRKQKHNCECGGKYIQPNKARHLKSKKHQDYIAFMTN